MGVDPELETSSSQAIIVRPADGYVTHGYEAVCDTGVGEFELGGTCSIMIPGFPAILEWRIRMPYPKEDERVTDVQCVLKGCQVHST